ncbi:MAG: primosomal replication protein N [Burkholderiaceae bacterium]|jgi:primosomal replication protein N|nr:primosomal replication protein N [Burkholderiaceae bacterium]
MNQLRLAARIVEMGAPRHTPAGLPALDLRLEHQSQMEEAGQQRQVKAALKAVALGAIAERLSRQAVGSEGCFSGFLASSRGARSVVFHIQDFFLQDQFQGGS